MHRDHDLGFGKLLKVMVSTSREGAGTSFAPSWRAVETNVVLFDAYLLHASAASATTCHDRIVLTFAALDDDDSCMAAHRGVVHQPMLKMRCEHVYVRDLLRGITSAVESSKAPAPVPRTPSATAAIATRKRARPEGGGLHTRKNLAPEWASAGARRAGVCLSGHEMTSSRRKEGDETLTCDAVGCGKPIFPGMRAFSCEACDYDVCSLCCNLRPGSP
jgi:hypothetical protein